MSSGDLRTLLRNGGYARLYTTRLTSQTGDGVFQASLASAVLFNPEHAADPAVIAGAFAVLLVPYSVVGPFAGVLLDRWRRQRVLVVANLIRAALVVAVALTLVAHGPTGPAFVGLALAAVSVNRFLLAALSAALPHVVATRELVAANSLSTTSGTLVAGLGGALAVGLRRAVGAGDTGSAWLALAGAVLYTAAAGVARTLGRDRLGPHHRERTLSLPRALATVTHGLSAGARHVWGRRPAAAALLAIGAARFASGLATFTALLLYRNSFTDAGPLRAGLAGLAQLVAATVIGYVTAAMVTPVVTARIRKETWTVTLFAVTAVAEVGLALPFAPAPLLAAAFVLGFVAQAVKICVDTVLQEQVDDDFRGRVFSLYDMLFNIAFVAAAAVGAAVLPASGRSVPVVLAVGAVYAATALGYGLVLRRAGRRGPGEVTPTDAGAAA